MFDLKKGWKDPPPGRFSTHTRAAELAAGLHARTGRTWLVTLVEKGKCRGGMHIAPSPERLVDGLMSRDDWAALKALFRFCVVWKARRWFIFADEIETCLRVVAGCSADRRGRRRKDTCSDFPETG